MLNDFASMVKTLEIAAFKLFIHEVCNADNMTDRPLVTIGTVQKVYDRIQKLEGGM